MPLNSFLKKILAATRLTRRGDLGQATAAIQRALAQEAPAARPAASAHAAGASNGAADAQVLDGLVREVEPLRRTPAPRVEVTLSGAGGAVTDFEVEALEHVEAEAAAGVGLGSETDLERRRSERFTESSFTAAAGTRGFKLFEPAGFEGRALPLVVMLHGCTQDPDDFAAGTRMNRYAQEHGLLVLYPAQAPRSNAHKCWNWFVPGDQRRGQGEPALLAGMVRHVMATHPIDADRVWVAGLSAGGAMAAILAREYPDLFAAAGVHSGLAPGAARDVVSALSAMKSGATGAVPGWPSALGNAPLVSPLAARPGTGAAEPAGEAGAEAAQGAPIIVFHGDADTTVNALNGSHVVDAALGSLPWQAARESGSVAEPAAAGGSRAFTRTVYRPEGATHEAPSRAEHWVVHGAGHAWSGGDSAGSFTERHGPDASREMLRFFAEHPRRGSAGRS